jgi:2-polyprenyl-3-methyl-5-hydroxy-6-metoxy-1,4-benzoquinol methylase
MSRRFHQDEGRDFLRCGVCALTFVPSSQHIDEASERARYAEHRNSPEDLDYRAFLDRLLLPLTKRLTPGARGLDYGCGPGPTASVMMRERGFVMNDYDPFFFPNIEALSVRYDFVVCTEVLEHLRRPAEVFARLDHLIASGGTLGVLTGILEDDAVFPAWWYHRDPTHISFYRPETLTWIATRHGWSLERPGHMDAAIFRRGVP